MIGSFEQILLICMISSWIIGGVGATFLVKRRKASNQFAYFGGLVGSLFGIILAISTILFNSTEQFQLWSVTSIFNFKFSIDALSGFFLFLITAIAFIVSIYAPSYVQKYSELKNISLLGAGFNLFLISMVGVVLAHNGFTFLVMWEMMSLISFFLVIYEHERKEVRQSGMLYVIMTHIATGFIIIAFLVLFLHSGSLDFSILHEWQNKWSMGTKNLIFILMLIGFGTKAGLVPIHIWLPQAHPVAPSHISALMSAVMIKTAIYGLIRVVYGFLGVSSIWWGVTVLIVGMITAIYGILYGVVQQDMKRFLAYSSVENIGLIFMGLGVSFIFAELNMQVLAVFSLLAALYHTLNHAFFKGLLFMGAGAVYSATGTRNIDQLGGLIRYMPQTAGLFLIGSLAIASFPPLNGFISKWLTIQALLELPFASENIWLSLLGTFGVVALILVGALVGLGFVKLFGVIFLAQERSPKVKEAKEVPLSMRISMGIAAIGIVGLGLFPNVVINYLTNVTSLFFPETTVTPGALLSVQSVSETGSAISPVFVILAIGIVLLLVLALLSRWLGKSVYEKKEPWACGVKLQPEMSYSGMSLSHPLLLIFKPVFGESFISSVSKRNVVFKIQFRKVFNRFFYDPLVRFVMFTSKQIRKIQDGSIHSYLAYIFLTLIVLLLVVTIN